MSGHVEYLRTLQKHYVDEANANVGTEAEYQYGGDALCVKAAADHLADIEAKYATLLERVRLYENKQGVNMPNNKISKTLEKCVVPRLRFHGSTSMAGKLADDIERLNQLVKAAKYAIGCYENGSGMAVPINELRNALRNIELESEAEV